MDQELLTEIQRVLDDVVAERKRQVDKWGTQRLEWPVWLAVLTEEVGESAEAALEAHFETSTSLDHLREELIQVAAVAVAIVEHIDAIDLASEQPRSI